GTLHKERVLVTIWLVEAKWLLTILKKEEIVVQGLKPEKYSSIGAQEFVPFEREEVTLHNIKNTCKRPFAPVVGERMSRFLTLKLYMYVSLSQTMEMIDLDNRSNHSRGQILNCCQLPKPTAQVKPFQRVSQWWK
ncbi:hypothetical protein P5673_010665, partial [Acropora cervicornis]